MQKATSPSSQAQVSVATAVLAASLSLHPAPPVSAAVDLVEVTGGLSQPVAVANAGDGSGRLFVLERAGRVRIVDAGGSLLPTPFLDIDADVLSNFSERGLLGIAFHPDYAVNGRFFVYYTVDAGAGDPLDDGDSVLEELTVSADPDLADPASRRVILTAAQPDWNHNGGQLAFGPDGYLYLALGDGGGSGDTYGNGQNRASLLGAILRLDVDGDDFPGDDSRNYAIPPDNPFVSDPTGADEIWSWGLRNPWRFSFDRCTGDMFIGDVGQNVYEEIDLQRAGTLGGVNWGWNECEGMHPFAGSGAICGTDADGFAPPILEYTHGGSPFRCSVTGGYRYRGNLQPELAGLYLYGDYCAGTVWAAAEAPDGTWSESVLVQGGPDISAFGEGEDGELYLAGYDTGRIYHIVDTVDGLFVDGLECGLSAWSGFTSP